MNPDECYRNQNVVTTYKSYPNSPLCSVTCTSDLKSLIYNSNSIYLDYSDWYRSTRNTTLVSRVHVKWYLVANDTTRFLASARTFSTNKHHVGFNNPRCSIIKSTCRNNVLYFSIRIFYHLVYLVTSECFSDDSHFTYFHLVFIVYGRMVAYLFNDKSYNAL